MRKLLFLVVLLLVVGAGAWVAAGFAPAPVVEIVRPTTAIGQAGQLTVLVDTRDADLSRLDVSLEQNGATIPVFSLTGPGDPRVTRDSDGRMRLVHPIGKRQTPELDTGRVRLVVTAGRAVYVIRERRASVTRDLAVRLVPPQVAVLSTRHYINHGGSEMVVYRASPPDVSSGVRVGELEYSGFPASGAGIAGADPALRVAFFALLWNQEPDVQISVFARDDAGNEATTPLEHRVFPKTFRQSRIEIDDRFLAKVVPAILQNTPDFRVDNPSDLVASFQRINRDMRRVNDSTIAAYAGQTSTRMLWSAAFKQLTNTAVEAGFADRRTYLHKGAEIDRATHLGFDLASTAAAPALAANSGRVVHAGWLGIYGNCVILDHGMGLQSLYAHLSSIGVARGDSVSTDQELGRTGSTGLAGGDHLHFTFLVGGRAVTPIDWWSSKWVEDRILLKLREAGAGAR